MSFAELRTRPGDAFAAELRQTATLLLAYAASAQVAQLLKSEDEVFLKQTFPRAGTLSAPGWANLWDLLPETAAPDGSNSTAAAPPAKFAPLSAPVELLAKYPSNASTVLDGAPYSPPLTRWFLNA